MSSEAQGLQIKPMVNKKAQSSTTSIAARAKKSTDEGVNIITDANSWNADAAH